MNANSQSTQTSPEITPEQHHRRQAAWQIWVPLGLILAIFLTAGVLMLLFTMGYAPEAGLPDQQSPLAKGSVIFLVAGACLGSLLQLLLLVGLVLLSGKMIKGLPGIAHRVQNALTTTAALAKQAGDKLAGPVVTIASLKAALNQLVKSLQFWKKKQVEEK